MMQYQGQTFPTERLPGTDDAREDKFENVTSCDGVIDPLCQSAIIDIIQNFNSSQKEDGRCLQFTRHMNMNLQE